MAKRSGIGLSADNEKSACDRIGAEACLKAMAFHGKPRVSALTNGRAFCQKQAKFHQSAESAVLTGAEKLVNLWVLSNRLGSPRVTLGGSFFSCGCDVLLVVVLLDIVSRCAVRLSTSGTGAGSRVRRLHASSL
jgi:hypothetical protein